MRTDKLFALVMATTMLLAALTVVGATNGSAAGMAVELKRPGDGATWIMGKDYRVGWSYPNIERSQIISVRTIGDHSVWPSWSWSAVANPGTLPPTTCILHVPEYSSFVGEGRCAIGIEVTYYSQPGVEETASDLRTVNIVDRMAPTITGYPLKGDREVVVRGADSITSARMKVVQDYPGSALDLSSVKVMVDGRAAPADQVTVVESYGHAYVMEMDTDWLSRGGHRVTLTVADNSGNTARATWIVQVVRA